MNSETQAASEQRTLHSAPMLGRYPAPRPFTRTISAVCLAAAVIVHLCLPVFAPSAPVSFARNPIGAVVIIAFALFVLTGVRRFYRGHILELWPLILPFFAPNDADLPAHQATYTSLYIIGLVFALAPHSPRSLVADEHTVLYHSRRTNFTGTMLWVGVVVLFLVVVPVHSLASRPGTWNQKIAADPFTVPMVALGLFLIYKSSKTLIRPGRVEVTVFRNGVSYFDSLTHGSATLEQWVPIEHVEAVRHTKRETILTIKDFPSIKIPRGCLESPSLGPALQAANSRIKITDDRDT